MKSALYEQIFFEIAMSIGNSTDLEVMLRESLTIWMRRLNCLAGIVYRQTEFSAEEKGFEEVYRIPKRMRSSEILQVAQQDFTTFTSGEEIERFLDRLPLTRHTGLMSSHLLELPQYGLLLLVKSGEPFDPWIVKSLLPLATKLAGACRTCDMRKKLSQEMAERQQAELLYRGIIENAVEGMFRTTLDGKIMHANRSLARMLAYDSPQDFMDNVQSLSEDLYAHPEDRDVFLQRLREKGEVTGFEVEFKHKDGFAIWVSLSAKIAAHAQGETQYIEGFCEVISERKRAELALREAKEEAERLHENKSNFLTMISHELRTPLTSVLGFARVVEKQLSTHISPLSRKHGEIIIPLRRIQENLQIIQAEGKRLSSLIEQVLDLQRLESSEFALCVQDIRLEDILRHSLSAMRVLFEEKGIELVDEIAQNLPEICADADRVVQVTINLLSNALKFTEQGSVTLKATEEKDLLRVEISDTGVGISADELPHVFDKFKQVGDTVLSKHQGYGLGLPICQEIIRHHGGDVYVSSQPGKGSTFSYTLPLHPEQ